MGDFLREDLRHVGMQRPRHGLGRGRRDHRLPCSAPLLDLPQLLFPRLVFEPVQQQFENLCRPRVEGGELARCRRPVGPCSARSRFISATHSRVKASRRSGVKNRCWRATSAIHTFFMRFAIDVAFVSRDGRVLEVRAAVKPWRISGAWRAFAVIELPAGALEQSDTRPGDLLQVTPT